MTFQSGYELWQCGAFSRSVMSDSLGPWGLSPTRLLCPQAFEARILECVTQGSDLSLLHWQADSSPLGHQEPILYTVLLLLSWVRVRVRVVELFETPWTVAHQVLCPWNSPGETSGVGCCLLLQGLLPTQGLKPCLRHLLHWQTVLHP